MESGVFAYICKTKFSYLVEEYGFNNAVVEEDDIKSYVIFEKQGIQLKIVNQTKESQECPIALYIITEKKTVLNVILKKTETCNLDDLLLYRKCSSQVYEYFDYSKIETFYKPMPEEDIEYYKVKYSTDEEIKTIIDKYSKLLKTFGSDILEGNFGILPEIRRFKKENDKKYGG